MTRRHWRWIARGLLFAFLFAQGAVSVYACIGASPGAQVSAAIETMPDCDGMPEPDPAGSNLCKAHCLSEQLTVDQHWQPDTEPGPLGVLVAPAVDAAMSMGSLRAADARRFTAAAPPSHAILHCCLRI